MTGKLLSRVTGSMEFQIALSAILDRESDGKLSKQLEKASWMGDPVCSAVMRNHLHPLPSLKSGCHRNILSIPACFCTYSQSLARPCSVRGRDFQIPRNPDGFLSRLVLNNDVSIVSALSTANDICIADNSGRTFAGAESSDDVLCASRKEDR